eukprot:TRINITY_DN47_c0_g3_i2.p1 TRINITY_DN47_c0_g3~~TRINITY_DN47_c0_g3_i2.p1  ORF type:complete len:2021 (-),score=473.42 TRINITY_DN47_c0_g3_i2:28977-34553(-)
MQEYVGLIKEQTNGIKELKQNKERLEEEYKKLLEENCHKQMMIDQKVREIASLNEVFEKISEENRQLTKELENERMVETVGIDREYVVELFNEFAMANQYNISEIYERIEEKLAQLTTIISFISKSKSTLRNLAIDRNTLKEQVAGYEQTVSKLRAVLNKTQSEKAIISKQLHDSEANFKRALSEKDKTIQELSKAKNKVDNSGSMGKITELEKELQVRTEEISMALQEMLQMKVETEKLRDFVLERDEEYTEHCKILKEITNTKGESEEKLEEALKEIEVKDKDIGRLVERYNELMEENNELANKVAEIEKRAVELEDECTTNTDLINEKNEEIILLKQELNEAEEAKAKNIKYEAVLNELKEFVESEDRAGEIGEYISQTEKRIENVIVAMKTLVGKYMGIVARQKEEIRKLREEMTRKAKDLAELNNKQLAGNEGIEKMQEKCEELETKNKDLEEQCAEQKITLNQQWEAIISKEEAIKEKEREYVELKEKFEQIMMADKAKAQHIKHSLTALTTLTNKANSTISEALSKFNSNAKLKLEDLNKKLVAMSKTVQGNVNAHQAAYEQQAAKHRDEVAVNVQKIKKFEKTLENLQAEHAELTRYLNAEKARAKSTILKTTQQLFDIHAEKVQQMEEHRQKWDKIGNLQKLVETARKLIKGKYSKLVSDVCEKGLADKGSLQELIHKLQGDIESYEMRMKKVKEALEATLTIDESGLSVEELLTRLQEVLESHEETVEGYKNNNLVLKEATSQLADENKGLQKTVKDLEQTLEKVKNENKEELAKLNSLNQELNNKVQEHDKEEGKMLQEKEQLTEQIKDLTVSSEKLKTEIEQLLKEKNEAEAVATKQKETATNLENEVHTLQHDKNLLNENLNRLLKEKDEVEAIATKHKEIAESMKNEIQTLKHDIANCKEVEETLKDSYKTEINRLSEENTKCNETIDSLNKQLTALQENLEYAEKTKDEEIRILSETVTNYEKTVENDKANLQKLTTDKKACEEEIKRLNTQIENYQVELKELKETFDNVKSEEQDSFTKEITRLADERNNLKIQVQELSKKVKELNDATESYKATINELANKEQAMNEQIADLQEKVEDNNKDRANLEETVAKHKTALDKFEAEKSKYTEEIEGYKEQVLQLEDTIKAKIKDNDDLHAKLAKFTESEKDLRGQIESLQEKLEISQKAKEEETQALSVTLQENTEKHESEKEQLKEEIIKCKVECDKLANEKNESTKEINGYKEKLEQLNETLKAKETSLENYDMEIAKLTEDRDRLIIKLNELDQKHKEDMSQWLDKVNAQTTELQEKLEVSEKAKSDMHSKLTEEVSTLKEKYEKDNTELKADIEKQKADAEKLVAENINYKDEIASLRQEIEEHKAQAEKLQEVTGQIDKLNEENSRLYVQIEEKAAHVTELKESLSRSQAEYNELSAKEQDLNNQILNLKEQLESLEKAKDDEMHTKLKETEEKHKTELNQLITERDECVNKLKDQIEEHSAKVKELLDNKEQMAKITEEKDHLSAKAEKQEKQIAEIQSTLESINKQINEELSAEGITSVDPIKDISTLIGWYKNEFAQLEQEKDDIEQSMSSLKNALAKFLLIDGTNDVPDNAELIAKLEAKLSNKSEDLQEQVLALKEETQSVQTALATKENEIATLKKNVGYLLMIYEQNEDVMISFSAKLNKIADENDTLLTELEEIKDEVTTLVEKFPPGDHEPYIYELLRATKCSEAKIEGIKKKRAAMVGRKSLGFKRQLIPTTINLKERSIIRFKRQVLLLNWSGNTPASMVSTVCFSSYLSILSSYSFQRFCWYSTASPVNNIPKISAVSVKIWGSSLVFFFCSSGAAFFAGAFFSSSIFFTSSRIVTG